jgi:toxin ParE1/3/4
MTCSVVFSPEARTQLIELDALIAVAATPEIAARYTDANMDFCHSLRIFPERGTRRDDIRPGIRITHFRKRTIIAFSIEAATKQVLILGVYYGGQDYESDLEEAASE